MVLTSIRAWREWVASQHPNDRFSIPTIASGNYQVDAKGETNEYTASATFTVGGASVW